MKVLEIKNVNKYYKIGKKNKFHALKDIDLSFETGELVSILGESGSGKSTLMNLIGGLDSDFSGSIKIEEKDIHKYSEKELDAYRKNKIGFIFQSFNLINHLSILDNVTIAMTLSNVSKKERVERATVILKDLGLLDQIHKKPNQLSGGQKQRVAIARALINDPEILLCDEPTGALDSETSKQILKIIKDISDQGKLVIMVTHSVNVSAISSRIIEIKDGEITKDKYVNKKQIKDTKKIDASRTRQNLSLLSAIKLSLRNMHEKIGRNILVSLGASIGIMSIIIMLSIGQGIENYITNIMNENVNPLVIEVNMPSDLENSETPADIQEAMEEAVYFETENIEELTNIKHVEAVEKGFSISRTISSINMGDEAAEIVMIDTVSSTITDSDVLYGVKPSDNEMLISYAAALDLIDEKDMEKLIGETVNAKIVVNQTIIEEDLVISGILAKFDLEMMDSIGFIYVSYDGLYDMFSKYDLELKPTTMYLVSESEEYTQSIKEEVSKLGYNGSMQEIMVDMFMEMLDVLTYILAAIAAISLFVSSIMILVVLYISVVERTKEIGVLKAIGARRKDIKRIFTTEAFLIGVSGGLVGIITSTLLSILINFFVNKLYGVNLIAYVPIYMLAGLFVSIIVSVLSGLMPASKASKLDPIESLRHE